MSFFNSSNKSSLMLDDFTRAYNRVVELYNVNAEKYGALSTINQLVTLKKEQKKEAEALGKQVEKICDDIINKINRKEKDGRNREIKEANEEEIGYLKHKFSETFGKQIFRWELDKIQDSEDLEKVIWIEKEWLKKLSDLFGGDSVYEIEGLIKEAHRKAFIHEKNLAQLSALESVTSELIRDGFNGYPKNINSLPFGSDIAKEKFNEAKPGRPLEEKRVEQSKIDQLIQPLIIKGFRKEDGYAKYWHHSGRWKGKPNKYQLREKIRDEELDGGFSNNGLNSRIMKSYKDIKKQLRE